LLSAGTFALQCEISGECTGELIGFSSQNSSAECLSSCKDTDGCTWYTYGPEDEICEL